MKKEENQRKSFLIKKMLEAKEIEIKSKEKNFLNKIKHFFIKPKETEKEKIDLLKKSLETKEVEELEEMILEKEESILALKKVVETTEKEKLKEIIKVLNEIKNQEGEREKIGREVGLKKKEVKEIEQELIRKMREMTKEEKSGKITQKKEIKTGKTTQKKRMQPEKTTAKKVKKISRKTKNKKEKKKKTKKIKKSSKGKQKKKERGKKITKHAKEEMEKKEEISFTSPIEELKAKREEEVKSKRKNAMEEFHKSFTSGREKTLVSIKGDTKIIAGRPTQTETSARTTAEEKKEPVYYSQGKTNEELDFEIQKAKEKMKNLKSAFFHRRINEEDYKKKLFEYQEELQSLEMEKRRPKNTMISKTRETKTKVREINSRPDRRKAELRTIQEESIQYATKHTPKSKAKVKHALKEFSQDFSAEPYFGKAGNLRQPIRKKGFTPTEQQINEAKLTGIVKRLAPGTNKIKEKEMEAKINLLMQRNKIPESQIRREFEFVSSKDLLTKFDRILETIDGKYARKEMQSEEIKDEGYEETAITAQKKIPKNEGEIKEIQEKKIVTDFDKLLSLVKEKGKINEKTAVKTLNLTLERIKECCTVLEKNNLVLIEYPVFGGIKIVSKDYIEPKKEKNKKKVIK